jgi:diacylglycerol kinase
MLSCFVFSFVCSFMLMLFLEFVESNSQVDVKVSEEHTISISRAKDVTAALSFLLLI